MKIQTHAPLVKIGVSRQVVIPKKIHRDLGLAAGDYLEVERRGNQVILTPKDFIDRELALALEDVRRGRTHGPFDSAEEMLRDLHKRIAQHRRAKKSPRTA